MAQKLILSTSKIPALYSQESVKDPLVHVKLYTPYGGWVWLLTEYDPEEKLAFGFCYNSLHPDGAELGYVSLEELESLRVFGKMPAVERDICHKPMKLSEAKKAYCPNL